MSGRGSAIVCVGLLSTVGLGGCSGVGDSVGAAAPNVDGAADRVGTLSGIELLAELMTGRFSSAEQSARDPDYLPIEVVVRRVPRWSGEGRVYLYVEQALAGQEPYRRRVYVVSKGDGGGLESRVLWLPEDWAEDWDGEAIDGDGTVLPGVEREMLDDRGCVVELERALASEQWVYAGQTRGLGCPSDFRGAVRATSRVWFGWERFAAWDRGWGPTDAQVWGPEEGPYVFDRVE